MGKWRPIRTAPKDGSSVLLFMEGRAIEAEWVDEIDRSGEQYGPGYWNVARLSSHGCGCCSSDNDPPTHWQPLPTPPQPAAGEDR